jgi:hypothetical protein
LKSPTVPAPKTASNLPDFIALIDDGPNLAGPLRLIVEIKGIHGEGAKDKRSTIEIYWLPSVNRLGTHGRWAFLELTDPFTMAKDFKDWIAARVKEQGCQGSKICYYHVYWRKIKKGEHMGWKAGKTNGMTREPMMLLPLVPASSGLRPSGGPRYPHSWGGRKLKKKRRRQTNCERCFF